MDTIVLITHYRIITVTATITTTITPTCTFTHTHSRFRLRHTVHQDFLRYLLRRPFDLLYGSFVLLDRVEIL